MSAGLWRRPEFVILPLLVLAILLLRPVCDVLEMTVPGPVSGAATALTADHHSPESVPCCASIEGGSQIQLASGASGGKSFFVVSEVEATVRVPLALAWYVAVDPAQPPPRSLPYHARTARILV